MRVQITGKVVKSEKKKPDSKSFTTHVLQTEGVKAELFPIYTTERLKEGEVTLLCEVRLNSWKDRNGDVHHDIMTSQVQETSATTINPIKRAV